jgi:hypothetical protein
MILLNHEIYAIPHSNRIANYLPLVLEQVTQLPKLGGAE